MSETPNAPRRSNNHEQSGKYSKFQIKGWVNFDATDKTLAEIAEDEGGNVAKAATGDPKVIPRRTGVKRRKKGAKTKVWHSNRLS